MWQPHECFIGFKLMKGDDNWIYETYKDGYIVIWAEDIPMWYVRFDGDTAKFVAIDESTRKEDMPELIESSDAYMTDWREELRITAKLLSDLANMVR